MTPARRLRPRRWKARAGLLRTAALGVVWIVPLTLGACTFEPRVEQTAEQDDEVPLQVRDLTLAVPAADPDSRARETVEQFRDAVTVGDLSLALGLLTPEAVLGDATAGTASEAASRGEFLLELRARHMAGMHFEPVETEVVVLGDGAAMVFSLLAMLEEGERGLGEEVGRSFETVLVVDQGDGWRIGHLHRSAAPEP